MLQISQGLTFILKHHVNTVCFAMFENKKKKEGVYVTEICNQYTLKSTEHKLCHIFLHYMYVYKAIKYKVLFLKKHT